MNNKKQEAEKLAQDVLDFVNAFGYDEEAFADAICRGHKTLQQSTMRLFMTTIRKMATVTPDGRNENAVKLAKEIVAVANKYALPLI